VYAIHKLFRTDTELNALYAEHAGKYKDLKEALIADTEALIAPMREKRANISDADVVRILKDGGEKARERAGAKMKIVRERVGVAL
jgi:tryptophanyl-tRNA synthetase